MKSIRRTLLAWLIVGMTLVVTLAAATVYLRRATRRAESSTTNCN